MTTEATPHTLDEGLRILARIIARDWAKRHLPKECAESRANDDIVSQQSPTEAVPAA